MKTAGVTYAGRTVELPDLPEYQKFYRKLASGTWEPRTFEVLARVDMGAPLMATPAISNRTLFIRTPSEVYAIGATPVSKTAAR